MLKYKYQIKISKGFDYMSQENYIRNLLNIKDENIKFYNFFVRKVLKMVKNVSLLMLIYLIFLLIVKSVVLYLPLKKIMKRKDFLFNT